MNRKVSVAPMMDCTDRHERFFLRLISKNTFLYTEMIVDEAINRGNKKKLLEFNINEKPVALQLGGSSPKLLAEASKIDPSMKPLGEGAVPYSLYPWTWHDNDADLENFKAISNYILHTAEVTDLCFDVDRDEDIKTNDPINCSDILYNYLAPCYLAI